MSKSSNQSPPRGAASQPDAAAVKRERVARWREGLARLKEEGRLLWLLGQGLEVILAAEESESASLTPEQVAAAVGDRARQALVAQPVFQVRLSAPAAKVRAAENPSARDAASVPLLTGKDAMLDGKSLADIWCPVIWIATREWRQVGLVTLTVAVAADGRKRILSVRPGSVREQGVAAEVLADLSERGLSIEPGVLVVTDGGRLLDDALGKMWPRAVVSHSRRQLLKDLMSHLVESDRATVGLQVEDAWTLAPAEAANTLHRLAKKLQRSAPGAAERLGRSIDASLVVDRLGTPVPLQERLVSMGTVNQALDQAHAFADHGGGIADLLAGLIRWLVNTRRVMGWQSLGAVTRAIEDMVSNVPMAPENEDCTPVSKAVQHKG